MTKRYTVALVPGYSGNDHLFHSILGLTLAANCAESYASKAGAIRGYYRAAKRWNAGRLKAGQTCKMPPSVKAVPFIV